MHATGQQYSYLIVSISVCLQLRFVNLSINEYDDDDDDYLRYIVHNLELSYDIGPMVIPFHSCTRMNACIRHGTFLILVCCVQDP